MGTIGLLYLPDDDARVVPAKAEAVAHGVVEPPLASRVGRVIEIAVRIRVGEVDRRGDHALDNRLHGHNRLDPAAGSERVAKLALRAADADLLRMLAKDPLDCLRLG